MTEQEIEFSIWDKDAIDNKDMKASFIQTLLETSDDISEEDRIAVEKTLQEALQWTYLELDEDEDEDEDFFHQAHNDNK